MPLPRESATDEHDPTWAPTEGRLAFARGRADEREIVVWYPDDRFDPVTGNGWEDTDPAWSPDGEWIAFASEQEGTFDIWRMRPDGTGIERLTTGPAIDHDPTWSPDGRAIAFTRDEGTGVRQVYVLVLGSGDPMQITDAARGAKSPDWR